MAALVHVIHAYIVKMSGIFFQSMQIIYKETNMNRNIKWERKGQWWAYTDTNEEDELHPERYNLAKHAIAKVQMRFWRAD